MSYQEVYKQKLTTADEAVKAVKSGDWVDYGWSVCSADALDKALARRMGELTDVKIRGGILTHKPAIFDVPNAAEHFCSSQAALLIFQGSAYFRLNFSGSKSGSSQKRVMISV